MVSIEIISKENRTITAVEGDHDSFKSNSDVSYFESTGKTMNYFPRKLEKFFKNLEIISINSANLSEISKEDIKVFTKLLSLSLPSNNIEVINADLFKFNPQITQLNLNYNKIKLVSSGAFDNLIKLEFLGFAQNLCYSGLVQAMLNHTKMTNFIKEIDKRCSGKIIELQPSRRPKIESDCVGLAMENERLRKELMDVRSILVVKEKQIKNLENIAKNAKKN